jgi:hypothetical protein
MKRFLPPVNQIRVGSGVWGLRSGVWGLRSGVWGLRSGVWGLRSCGKKVSTTPRPLRLCARPCPDLSAFARGPARTSVPLREALPGPQCLCVRPCPPSHQTTDHGYFRESLLCGTIERVWEKEMTSFERNEEKWHILILPGLTNNAISL